MNMLINKKIIPFLETDRLFLEKIGLKHCSVEYISWLNDPEVNRYLETGCFPIDMKKLEDYISDTSSEEIFLAIIDKKLNKHIGNIRLHSIDFRNGLAELGIMIGDRLSWGNGYAREAISVVLNHVFRKLNVRKITLGLVTENIGALTLYQKIGFQKEGVFREHHYYEGSYRDIIRMAIFQRDWLCQKIN